MAEERHEIDETLSLMVNTPLDAYVSIQTDWSDVVIGSGPDRRTAVTEAVVRLEKMIAVLTGAYNAEPDQPA